MRYVLMIGIMALAIDSFAAPRKGDDGTTETRPNKERKECIQTLDEVLSASESYRAAIRSNASVATLRTCDEALQQALQTHVDRVTSTPKLVTAIGRVRIANETTQLEE